MSASLAEIERAMLAEIRSPDGSGVYRTLVRRGLADVLKHQLPRTALHMGSRWDVEVARFLDATLPRSRYLRDTAFGFFHLGRERWSRDPDLPSFIVDLARWELLAFEVRNAPDDPAVALPAPLALERGVRLSLAARVVRFDHAVHLLPDDEASTEPPAREPALLCAYRDEEMEMCTLDLTPSAAEIVERLARGDALGEAVTGAAAACGIALDPAYLQGAASFLEDLTSRGVVRGPA